MTLKIAVDAGHGMGNTKPGVHDTGAEAASAKESLIVFDYAMAMRDALLAAGFSVFLTREWRGPDAPYSERARRAKAAGCVAFVSWHLNSADDARANGLEVLYRGPLSKKLAGAMQKALVAATGFKDRGIGTDEEKSGKSVAVLKFDGPAVLIELGFISNQRERIAVQRDDVRLDVARTAALVVAEFFGVKVPATVLAGWEAPTLPAHKDPAPAIHPLSREDTRRIAAHAIVQEEAGSDRRDASGRLAIYRLPKGDNGGKAVPGYPYGFEVAGVNNGYHPFEAGKLRAMIEAGKHAEAEARVTDYIATYTDGAVRWADGNAGLEIFLRDSILNRGPGGAAQILQKAVGFKGKDVDGLVGPKTMAAVKSFATPELLLEHLREARERYERTDMGRDESSQFWLGLKRRWDRMYALARRYV